MESLNNLGSAFENAFGYHYDGKAPASNNLLQININNLVVTESDSESESESESSESSDSDSSSDSEDEEKVLIKDDVDHTMDCSSNNKDTGMSLNTIMDEYTGADNDDFMKKIVEDFGTKQDKTAANPEGVVLTKFNGEPASRRFVEGALHIDGEKLDKFMAQEFDTAWKKYDVNSDGFIQEAVVPTYLRSLLGDFTA
jgi:hypothetical protein